MPAKTRTRVPASLYREMMKHKSPTSKEKWRLDKLQSVSLQVSGRAKILRQGTIEKVKQYGAEVAEWLTRGP